MKTIITIFLLCLSILVYSEMTSAQEPLGGIVFFTDQERFERGCSDLPVEDFEDTDVDANMIGTCPNPFNNATDNPPCYSAGALIPGFTMSALNPGDPDIALAVLTPNFLNVTNVAAGPNFLNDDMILDFDPPIDAAGMVFISSQVTSRVLVSVFNEDTLLGTATLDIQSVQGTFIGVVSQTPITRIESVEIVTQSSAELLYELSFGQCFALTRQVPTLSEWGLIAMAGLLGVVGFVVIRRRQATA